MATETPSPRRTETANDPVPTRVLFLLAISCGLIVANLYYAQPLIGLIAPEIGLMPSAASLIVTLTQIGYGIGLILLVPLGDLVENRKLVLWLIGIAFMALVVAAGARSAPVLLSAALFIGLGSVATQVLIPLATHMTPEASRGRIVGTVMSGLLAGIMLARPVSSFVASAFGWRAVLGGSAVVMVALGLILKRYLPRRMPTSNHRYPELIGSLWTLLRTTPTLSRRALYQAALFAAFTLYWTAVPLLLSGPLFGLTQKGIALFSLAGVSGVFAAPVAGHLADRGLTHLATGLSLALVAAAFLLAHQGSSGSLVALVAAAIVLDLGVQANLVLGQRTIYALGTHVRSRLNGLYMAIFFAGGALGSAIASVAFARGGWSLVSRIGLGFPITALLFYATERASKVRRKPSAGDPQAGPGY